MRWKPFIGAFAGESPVRQSLTSSRERVLRGVRATGTANFRHEVRRAWRKWLDRRNRKRQMTWEQFARLEQRYPLPLPKIYHQGTT